MRISQIFNLNKTQPELDFIDIDIETDIPLFLDPFFLRLRQDNFSLNCSRTIRSFFQTVVDRVRNEDLDGARELFNYLHEPNETCLGLSTGRPQGRGVGNIDTDKIFDRIIESRAIETGLLQDLEDSVLFVDQFDKDKLSDMTTNIIREHLMNYTIQQCVLHGIPTIDNIASGYYWSIQNRRWEAKHAAHLVINERKVLLVPKGVVSFKKQYTAPNYYNHFVLNFLQNENLELNTALVQERKNGVRFVTKKSLKERNPLSKDFLREFTLAHPEVLESFKDSTTERSLLNEEIEYIDMNGLCNRIADYLATIPTGAAEANRYYDLTKSILEILFYPKLINPSMEQEIHEGRKRIDITFDNAAEDGLFFRLGNNMNIPSSYIMIECKNYSTDPVNPEIDQLSGRFSVNRGRFGILLCRSFNDRDRFIQRCRDTFNDQRGLIIPLTDEDLILMLRNYDSQDDSFVENLLADRVREIAV